MLLLDHRSVGIQSQRRCSTRTLSLLETGGEAEFRSQALTRDRKLSYATRSARTSRYHHENVNVAQLAHN